MPVKPPDDIAIDFDGTVVIHEFPRIGRDVGAVPVLKELIAAGHRLHLNTMRSNMGSDYLDQAVTWFKENDIRLAGININPGQRSWTTSPKVQASLYIDDCGLGMPLKRIPGFRPFVDWVKTRQLLADAGWI